MSFLPAILIAVFALLLADAVRWKIVVGRELKHRNLVRIRSRMMVRITPARGFRVIEACTCKGQGKEYRVTILNRGWFRTRPCVEVVET